MGELKNWLMLNVTFGRLPDDVATVMEHTYLSSFWEIAAANTQKYQQVTKFFWKLSALFFSFNFLLFKQIL